MGKVEILDKYTPKTLNPSFDTVKNVLCKQPNSFLKQLTCHKQSLSC